MRLIGKLFGQRFDLAQRVGVDVVAVVADKLLPNPDTELVLEEAFVDGTQPVPSSGVRGCSLSDRTRPLRCYRLGSSHQSLSGGASTSR